MEDNKEPVQNEQQQEQQNDQTNYKDLYIRLNADLQNFKRRIDREKNEWASVAQSYILTSILPLFEDFDRALETTKDQALASETLDGFKLIQKNIKKTLADLGVSEIDTAGQFNPEYHEAISQVDAADHKTGDIVQVYGKGYFFKGKVIKHAQVSVAK